MSLAVTDVDATLIKADRKNTVHFAQRRAHYKAAALHQAAAVDQGGLTEICKSLALIAQRNISSNPSSFSDVVELVHCTKLLKKMGVELQVTERFKAVVETTGNETIIKSADYRHLRNKCIAGFATIADLTEKPAAVGSPDFQRGIREGYRRASDIAVMFLEDIQNGEPKC